MGMIHPPDPSAYEVRVPPVTLTHVGIMPWAPLGLPNNSVSWLPGGHDRGAHIARQRSVTTVT